MKPRCVIRQVALTSSLTVIVAMSAPLPGRPLETWTPAIAPSGAVATSDLTQAPSTDRDLVANALSHLPMAFEPNQGQAATEVKFLSRAPGYLLQLTATGMRMIVTAPPDQQVRGGPAGRIPSGAPAPSHALTLTWLNASRHPEIAPESPLPGIVNYLKGRDPTQWRTGIRTYARVRYAAIYPGIDVVYYGNDGQFEYDLVVAPHADPAAARLGLEGVGTTLDEGGDLQLALSDGRVLQLRAPVAYQERDGQRRAVEARYRLSAATTGTEVSFAIAAYDPDLPLIIDPLVYSTFLGGGGLDEGSAVAVSAADEVFVTGRSQSSTTAFPTTVGAFDTSHNVDPFDAFVTRLNSTGTALVYSTFLGSSGGDSGEGIAVNAANEAFVTGSTGGGVSDFPTTVTAFDTSHNGGNDGFVTRLNSTGTALVYSTFLGGSGSDYGKDIAVNAANEAFVVGFTADAVADFPTTATAFDTSHNGRSDVFVTRLNSTGSALVYSTFLGSSLDDYVGGIAINTADEAFVTGGTSDALTAFPTTAGAFDTRFFPGEAYTDAFVTRLNSAGTDLVYSTFLGALGLDEGLAIAVNAASEAFVTGITNKAAIDFPTTSGAFDTFHNGGVCVFVTRLNSTGSALVYSTFLGDGPGAGYGLVVNGANEAFVTGYTIDAAFPTTVGAFDSVLNSYDAFVTRLNADGTALVYSTFLGGSATDTGLGIALNAANEAFVTGRTSDDFPTTVGAFDTARNGGGDAFVARLATGAPGQAPDPPTNLRALRVAGNTVTFGWSAPTAGASPTGYLIEGGSAPAEVLGSLPLGLAPSVTITLPTGSYYLRVRTQASGVTSAASNEVLAHVNVAVAPSAPANLLGLVVGSNLSLAWTNTFGGGAPTNVMLDVSGAVSGSAPLGLTDTVSFAGVPAGTYTLSVRATNATGSSTASTPVTLTFPSACSGPPQTVTNFVAYHVGDTLFLNWDNSASGPAPTTFLLNVTGAYVGSIPTTLKALNGVVRAGTYHFSVVATNACGTSAPAAVRTVTLR